MVKRNILIAFCVGFISAIVLVATVYQGQRFEFKKGVVQSAQEMFGFHFTEAQIDSMLDGLHADLMSYESLRGLNIENQTPPAIYFNPFPPGHEISLPEETAITWELPETTLPENRDELAFYSILQLAYLIKNQKITSTELTEFYLQRLEKYGYELEAIITITSDRAIRQAQLMDREIREGKWRGPLHGIPYGAKDLFAVKEYKTTWGATPYKDQHIDQSATVIKKLDEAGAVLVVKLTLGALAWGDVWYGGQTKSPWNPDHGASGSSAGSGATVAAGLVSFALGTETLGSIISPATRNGITGLRPTFGRVSRHGAMALSWSMDKIGPMTRSAEDAAIVFDAIRGSDNYDFSVRDAGFPYQQQYNITGKRIGYLAAARDEDYPSKLFDEQVHRFFEAQGFELVPVTLPRFPLGAMSFILSVEAAAAFDHLTLSGEVDSMVRQIKNSWPNVFRTARFSPGVEYIQANRARTMYITEFHKIFDEVDVFISPSFLGGTLLATNLTGHPAIVMKNGYDDNNMPLSFTIIGSLFGEAELLQVADFWQKATEYHLQHPPGFY